MIVDLEDGVAPGAKAEARAGPGGAARRRRGGSRSTSGSTPGTRTTWRPSRRSQLTGIVVPKVARPEDVPAIGLPGQLPDRVGCRSRGRVRDRAALRESPGSRSASPTSARRPARSRRGSTGRAAGSSTPPSPPACRGRRSRSTRDVRDDEGLARSCARGRELGHLGRAAIHPAQLPIIEQAYLPTEDEVDAGTRDGRAARGRRCGHARGRRVRGRRDARRGAADRGLGRFVRHLNTSNIREELMKNRLTPALAGCAALLLIMLAPSAVGSSSAVAAGSLTSASFHSTTLNEAITYNVYLPAGYAGSTEELPRPLSPARPRRLEERLDADAGHARRADRERATSRRRSRSCPTLPGAAARATTSTRPTRGADPGRPVETAFTQDLIAHVDSTYRTVANRTGRGVAGYSMGGYGALRYSLAHPDLFGAAIVLSPAVYVPIPPSDSSTREFGAFGKDKSLFVEHDLQEAQLSGYLPVVRGDGADAADVHRRRRRRVQEPRAEGREARPRLRGPRPLQPGRRASRT